MTSNEKAGLKIGAIFPSCEIGNDPIVIRDFAQTAEALGYSHILAYDHVLGAEHSGRDPQLVGPYTENDPFHEPFTLFGYLAGLTERIELATGVIILPQRQIALVAKQSVQLAVLSQGRFRLGVGTGWNWVEYEALGESWDDRGARYDEQIEVLRRLWDEPIVDFKGQFHRIDRAGLMPRPPGKMPLWFGGMSKVAIKRAARMGDGFIMGAAFPFMLELAKELRDLRAAEGRANDDFGLETAVGFGAGPEQWHKVREEWESVGLTHLSMRAMSTGNHLMGDPDPGFTTPAQHIDALEIFMREMT